MASSAIQPPSQESSPIPFLSLQSTAIYLPHTDNVHHARMCGLLITLCDNVKALFNKHVLRVDLYRIICNTSTPHNVGQPNTFEYVLNVHFKHRAADASWQGTKLLDGFLEATKGGSGLLRLPTKHFEVVECDENPVADMLERLRNEGVGGIKECSHLVIAKDRKTFYWDPVFEEGRGTIG